MNVRGRMRALGLEKVNTSPFIKDCIRGLMSCDSGRWVNLCVLECVEEEDEGEEYYDG